MFISGQIITKARILVCQLGFPFPWLPNPRRVRVSSAYPLGCVVSAEWCSVENQAPELVGRSVAHQLLEQVSLVALQYLIIVQGGVVDASMQSMVLLFMCLCPEDVSRIRVGPLTAYTYASK